MELTIQNRILLLNILPKEGNILTLKLMRELKEELSFSEKEISENKIEYTDVRIDWDESKKYTKDVDISDVSMKTIKDSLKTLDQKGKLREEHISLWDLFME